MESRANYKAYAANVNVVPDYISHETISERNYYWAAVTILLLAIGLRLIGLDKGIWLDEYFSLRKAFSQDFLQGLRTYNHPPVYFVLLKLWSQISVREEFLRLLSVLFGVATVAVVMAWIKRYSYLGSLLGGIYCATLPIMLRYSQEIRGYSLLLLATALSFFFASRIIGDPERLSGYVGLGSSLTLGIATHAVGVMVPISALAYIAVTPGALREVRFKRLTFATLGPFLVFSLIFFVFLLKTDIDRDDWWMPSLSLPVILSTAKIVLGVDEARWLFEAIQDAVPILDFSGRTAAALALVVSGMAISLLGFGTWRSSLPMLAAALVFWAQIAVYSFFVLPIFRYRTVLLGMIPFIGFLGLQIASIRRRRPKVLAVIGLISLCLVFATQWTVQSHSSNWKEMAASLKSAWQPRDVILVFPQNVEGPFQYNTDLPSQAFLPIGVDDNIDEVEKKISGRIAGLTGATGPYAVFLITRLDRNVKKHSEVHRRLLAYLESKLGEPLLVKRISSLSLSRYESQTRKPLSFD